MTTKDLTKEAHTEVEAVTTEVRTMYLEVGSTRPTTEEEVVTSMRDMRDKVIHQRSNIKHQLEIKEKEMRNSMISLEVLEVLDSTGDITEEEVNSEEAEVTIKVETNSKVIAMPSSETTDMRTEEVTERTTEGKMSRRNSTKSRKISVQEVSKL